MNYVIKMGDLGWHKQKGKSCLRVVCPCAAYRGISFGLLAHLHPVKYHKSSTIVEIHLAY